MSFGEQAADPSRMHLIDLRTGEDLEVQFNPEEIEEELTVVYQAQSVTGLPHQVLQYVNTENHKLKLDLYQTAQNQLTRLSNEDFRKFLLSLCYPSADATSIAGGGPPRVLFVWPHIFSFTAVIRTLSIRHTSFAKDGGSIRSVAAVGLEEVRDVRLTSEEVRLQGTVRSSSGGGSESASS